ncbi:penicillin-binding transpeptidase domain-containing protein [Spirillospora sp. NPDC048911]|uniref:penicillin-binding transpeptidase domain-containing protein n=1 Tax=Spirillospora sp. NPDC048911 TaxID=3364527 RepID=UPI003713276E
MDKAVRRTWIVALLMGLALMVNVTYVQGFEYQDLRDDSHNARQFDDRNKIERGPIVAGGQKLAWSEKVKDEKTYRRRYWNSEVFAPITGYFSVFSQSALENAENHFLDGTDPRLATSNFLDKLLGRKTPGGSVETTINLKAQQTAYTALKSSGARRGAAVVLDAETGAILVMASTPSYDAGSVSTLDAKEATKRFKALNDDPLKPLLNKAMNEVFPPGSTFKTVVAAAALTGGDTKNSQVKAGRSYKPPGAGQAINNDAGDIGGQCDLPAIPLIDSYAQSCNTTFAYMGAEEPGNQAVGDQAAGFGFGSKVDVAEGKMTSAASSFPKTDQPSLSALGSIGQGSTVATPLQMAMVTAGVVNGGKVMRPYLVDKLRAPDGSVVSDANPKTLARPLTAARAGQMRDLMKAVVRSGTGKSLQGSSIVGGKTGTADVEARSYNDRWFIGYGPGSNPRYAVAVMTEAEGYGIKSGPIAAEIIDALAG